MRIEDIAGKKIRISASTITVLNDAGKTAGMITGVETFYKMQVREQLEHHGRARKAGVKNWSRLFLIRGQWYFIADDAALARSKEWEAFDGPVPRERLEQAEITAIAFGATVIHVARADDTRRERT